MQNKDRIRDVTRSMGERYRMNQDAELTAKTIAEERTREIDARQDGRIKAEAAHILFLDLVGYSRCSNEDQERNALELRSIVRGTPEFQRAEVFGELIRVDTGDGMGLIFFRDPLAPVQCAIEIARALKNSGRLQLRMGVHTGPITRIPDINGNENVSGAGINLAQRVMDCGDAGHILLSAIAAEMVQSFEVWGSCLTDLGVVTVKHGTKIHVFNLVMGDVGNPNLPDKVRASQECTIEPVSVVPVAPIVPAPVEARAPVAANFEFDPNRLTQIEAELRHHIGPVARVLIREATRTAQGYADLYQRLAEEIPTDSAKRAFLDKKESISSPQSEIKSAPDSVPEEERTPRINEVNEEIATAAEKLLAHYIGPLARVLTVRALRQTANTSKFYQLLAEHLPTPAAKTEFLRKLQGDI